MQNSEWTRRFFFESNAMFLSKYTGLVDLIGLDPVECLTTWSNLRLLPTSILDPPAWILWGGPLVL